MTNEQIKNQLEEIKSLLKKKDDMPLSLKEAAAYLGFKPSYLYKLTHRKLIKFYKPSGKMLFFSKQELDEWVFSKSKVSTKDGVNQSGKLKGEREKSEVRSKNEKKLVQLHSSEDNKMDSEV